jgi:hypothetical protein
VGFALTEHYLSPLPKSLFNMQMPTPAITPLMINPTASTARTCGPNCTMPAKESTNQMAATNRLFFNIL